MWPLVAASLWITSPIWFLAFLVGLDEWLQRHREKRKPKVMVTFGGRERKLWERHRRVG